MSSARYKRTVRAKSCCLREHDVAMRMKAINPQCRSSRMLVLAGIVCLLYAPAIAGANLDNVDPLVRLQRFLQAKAFATSFSQQVYDAKHSTIGDSSGTFTLLRPGRFRCEYFDPRQIIVSDGLNLVIYDPGLNQASVQPVAEALGNAPIAMLMGEKAITDRFHVKRGGTVDDIDWILLTPKVQDIEFTRIELGLDKEKLVKMTMLDHFDQTTIITFLHSQLDPVVPADTFRLYLPPTVDIIGEYLLPPIIPAQP